MPNKTLLLVQNLCKLDSRYLTQKVSCVELSGIRGHGPIKVLLPLDANLWSVQPKVASFISAYNNSYLKNGKYYD